MVFVKSKLKLIDTSRKQLYNTTSSFFHQPPLQLALDIIGIDNIMVSVDYPFSTNKMNADFLNEIKMPAEDIAKISHGNADMVLLFKKKLYYVSY